MSCFFSAAAINTAGLVFDIIGVVLLFRYALPEEVSRKGIKNVLWWVSGADEERTDEEQKKKAERYDRRACLGLVLIVVGFGLQIWSNWR